MKLGIPSFGILKSSTIKLARSKKALKSNIKLCMAKITSQRKKSKGSVKKMTNDVVVLLKSRSESQHRIASIRVVRKLKLSREDILQAMASNRKVPPLLNDFMDLLSEYGSIETTINRVSQPVILPVAVEPS